MGGNKMLLHKPFVAMAGSKMLLSAALLIAQLRVALGAANPCGTMAPAPVTVVATTVTTTPAPAATTVTTTPPPNCGSFTCPKGWTKDAKPDTIVCATGKCDMATCCNQNPCTTHLVTTVTTTPGTTVTTTPATTVTTTPAPEATTVATTPP